MALDPRIEVIRERYGLDKSDFWELAIKKGTWLIKHSALELAAVKAGIVFDMPVIIEKDAVGLVTSIAVRGEMEGRYEWSIGETNPSNYKVTGKQPSYPWAMSEKRAKDRVILKLIGIHGLVYSEDEMADADERTPRQVDQQPQEPVKRNSKATARPIDGEMRGEIDACQTVEELKVLWHSKPFQTEYQRHPDDWQAMILDHFNDAIKTLKERPPQNGPMVPPSFERFEGGAQ